MCESGIVYIFVQNMYTILLLLHFIPVCIIYAKMYTP